MMAITAAVKVMCDMYDCVMIGLDAGLNDEVMVVDNSSSKNDDWP